MKVPNTRYSLLTLTATVLVATFLALMNLGAGRAALAAEDGAAAQAQAGPSGPTAEALAPAGGAFAGNFLSGAHLPHFRRRSRDRGRPGGESHPNPD